MRSLSSVSLTTLSLAAFLVGSTGTFAQTTTPAAQPGITPDPVSVSDTRVGTSESKPTPNVDKAPATVSADPLPTGTPLAKPGDKPKSDVLPSPGEALDPHIKKGSEDDVEAIGTRDIGGRGMGNWYSTNWRSRRASSTRWRSRSRRIW